LGKAKKGAGESGVRNGRKNFVHHRKKTTKTGTPHMSNEISRIIQSRFERTTAAHGAEEGGKK